MAFIRSSLQAAVSGLISLSSFGLMFALSDLQPPAPELTIELPNVPPVAMVVHMQPPGEPDAPIREPAPPAPEPPPPEPSPEAAPQHALADAAAPPQAASAPMLAVAVGAPVHRVAGHRMSTRPKVVRMGRPKKQLSTEVKTRHKRRRSRGCKPKDNPAIVQVSDARYEVDKELVDFYSSNLKEVYGLAYATWNEDDAGKVDGFTLRRVRCTSPLHNAGFRSGDVVHTLNGRKVTNLPQAFRAYRKLKRKDAIRVQITRDGETRRLSYHLS